MFRRARSTESLCEERQASVSDVTMKMIAHTVVTLLRKVTEPRPGKPAALAGMMAGDVLVEANGHAVSYDAPISFGLSTS